MKKSMFIALLAVLAILMMATVASALNTDYPYYHGDFATNTVGCAQCHVTHAGQAASLLIDGPTQSDFCYFCHSDVSKSPYDVSTGKINYTATYVYASVAGGFDESFKFDTVAYNGATGSVGGNYQASTSRHGVESYDGSGAIGPDGAANDGDWLTGSLIPGGTTTLASDFKCGSCHNPHAGGDYTPGNGTVMPRLLNTVLPKVTVAVADYDDWTFQATAWSNANGNNDRWKTRVVTGYGDNAGGWCAGCHDLFNQGAHGAGDNALTNAQMTGTKYMHRMNFTLDDDAQGEDHFTAKNVINKIPLSVGGKLTCLTCHRAHGSSVTVTGVDFGRAATYKDSNGGTSATSTSTVLLREKERDVCYDCHGAAAYNRPGDQSS